SFYPDLTPRCHRDHRDPRWNAFAGTGKSKRKSEKIILSFERQAAGPRDDDVRGRSPGELSTAVSGPGCRAGVSVQAGPDDKLAAIRDELYADDKCLRLPERQGNSSECRCGSDSSGLTGAEADGRFLRQQLLLEHRNDPTRQGSGDCDTVGDVYGRGDLV